MHNQSPLSPVQLTVGKKIAWGLGGLTNDMSNALWVLAMPIFSVGLGVPAAWMGIALAVPRLWDALFDPLMGHVSDNFRSRWGRRRPFILVGAIGLGVTFALIWVPPAGLNHQMLVGWFLVTNLLFFSFFTIWNIPWAAMGLELTPNVCERNSVQAFRSWFASGAAFVIPTILPLAFYFGHGDEIAGVPWSGLLVGAVMIACALPALRCRETVHTAAALSRTPFLASACATLKDIRFLSLCILGALFTGGMILVGPMAYYVNVYYVYGHLPLKEAGLSASAIMFWGGIVGGAANLMAIPLIVKVANRMGKKQTLLCGVALIAISQLLKWSAFVPEHPMLQVWLAVLIYPGLILIWTIVPSMIADICDLDEWETGHRREGMYAAVFAFSIKLGLTLATAASGFLINWAGIVDGAAMQTPEAVQNMRLLFAILPAAFVVAGGLFVIRYSLRESDAEEVKRLLAQRATNTPAAGH